MRTLSFNKKCEEYSDPIIEKLAEYLEQSLIITDQQETFTDNPSESSDREGSPIFVVGPNAHMNANKYISMTNGNDTKDDNNSNSSKRSCQSSSQTDIPNLGAREGKEECHDSLPAQRNVFHHHKSKLGKDSLARLGKNLLSTSVDSLDSTCLLESLPFNSIVELWERSQIPKGRDILLDLGFDDDDINLVKLSKALEEEIPNVDEETKMSLRKACLVLQSTELSNLIVKSKRRTNIKAFNRRIALFAAESEEWTSSVEDVTKMEMGSLEEQQDGVVGDHDHLVNDCGNWPTFTTHLKKFDLGDITYISELEGNDYFESDQHNMTKQFTELLEKTSELHYELTESDELKHVEQRYETYNIAQSFQNSDDSNTTNTTTKRRRDSSIEESPRQVKIRKWIVKVKKSDQNIDDSNNINTLTKSRGDSSNEENPTFTKIRKGTGYLNHNLNTPIAKAYKSVQNKEGGSVTKRKRDSSIEETPRAGKFSKCTTNDSLSRINENNDTIGKGNSELQSRRSMTARQSQGQMEDYGMLAGPYELNTENVGLKDHLKEEYSCASYLWDDRTVSLDNAYNVALDCNPLVSLPLLSNQTVR